MKVNVRVENDVSGVLRRRNYRDAVTTSAVEGMHQIANGRFLRHRFSPKPTSIATLNSLPKRNHVAKEAVSAKRCSRDEAVALRKNHVARRRSYVVNSVLVRRSLNRLGRPC